MKMVSGRPKTLSRAPFTYCPGCGHGIAHRLIAEALDELDIGGRTLAVWPVGCAVFGDKFFNVDSELASHGKAPAVATGMASIRLKEPEALIYTYQGDGDLLSIGFNEIFHAANRGEKLTVFFINNAVYGMTSGQMAPTTVIGQKTTTTPLGRNATEHGYPIDACLVLSQLTAPAYIARVALTDLRHIQEAKKVIKKALETQMNSGFAFVEMLSPCPTNWKVKPTECADWIKKHMEPAFPVSCEANKYCKVYKERGQHA